MLVCVARVAVRPIKACCSGLHRSPARSRSLGGWRHEHRVREADMADVDDFRSALKGVCGCDPLPQVQRHPASAEAGAQRESARDPKRCGLQMLYGFCMIFSRCSTPKVFCFGTSSIDGDANACWL